MRLQQCILTELSQARFDDDKDDFTEVIDVSDTGRAMAVAELNNLFLRMQQGETHQNRPLALQAPPSAPQSYSFQPQAVNVPAPIVVDAPPTQPVPPGRAWTLPTDEAPTQQLTQAHRTSEPTPTKPRIFKPLNYWPRSQTLGSNNQPVAKDVKGRTGRAKADTVSTALTLQQRRPLPSEHIANTKADEHAIRRSTAPAIAPSQAQDSRRRSSAATTIPEPFRGFCKGAYYLQASLKTDAIKLRNQSASFQGEGYYYACSNRHCCFTSPAYKYNKEWDLDDKKLGPSHGLDFRWSLFAKSHIAQAKAKHRRYAYLCVFCCAMREGDSATYNGLEELLVHLSSKHRHQGDAVQGHLIVDGEDFDISFLDDGNTDDQASSQSGPSDPSNWATPAEIFVEEEDREPNPWCDAG